MYLLHCLTYLLTVFLVCFILTLLYTLPINFVHFVFRRYYKKQDDLIAAFEGIDLESAEVVQDTDRVSRTRRMALIMAKISFFANLVRLSLFQDVW